MVRGDAPHVTFRLVAPDARIGGDLIGGEVDVAIASALEGAGLRRATLLSDEFACLVRRDHPDVRGEISLAQLAALPHAVLGRPDAGLALVEAALVAAGVQRRVAIELPYFLLAPTLVPFSEPILIAPRTLGTLFALGYPLQVLDLPLGLPKIEEHIYWNQRFDADPAHAWLRAQVVRCVDEFFARIREQELPLVGAWPEIPPGHRS